MRSCDLCGNAIIARAAFLGDRSDRRIWLCVGCHERFAEHELDPDELLALARRAQARAGKCDWCATELPAAQVARLLEILDRELHIITPAEPAPDASLAAPPEPCYQLSHDYLVCPLREWLTQKQRASWRGRAELVLDERTAQWRRQRERRFLPGPVEHLAIVFAVPRRRRKPDQQAIVKASNRYYGSIAFGLCLLGGFLGGGALEINGRAQAHRLVQELCAVAPAQAERLVLEELPAYRRWAEPLLRELAGDPSASSAQQLRARLALLPGDRGQVECLQTSLTEGALDEYPTLRDEFLVPAALEDADRRAQLVAQAQAIVQETLAASATQLQQAELGSRRARAASLLIRLGQAGDALRACRDCECLGHFVARARTHGLQPTQLLDCLEQATQPAERYAVLLALGNFTIADLPEARRQSALDVVTSSYLHDPDAACHAACDWLLRQWGAAPPAASLRVERLPPAYPGARGRAWFVLHVAGSKLSFVTLPPGKFVMGSPTNEAYRVADEGQHTVEISRPLGVLDREVTAALWRQFLDDTGRRAAWEKRHGIAPRAEQPATQLDWHEAVDFCRWLTRQAGLPDSEQCYEQLPGDEKHWRFCPERAGFRLPTEAEWEYACRAGTPGTYSFGSEPALLGEFAVFIDNSQRQPAAVGSKRPNPRGLFDMHGNVWEWCSDAKASPSADSRDPQGPLTGPVRQYRGGSHDNHARHSRSACRISEQHTAAFPYLGFRVVCTLPVLERTAAEQ